MNFDCRPHVLLIEDNDYFARVLVDIFEIMGCEVTAVRDANSWHNKLPEIQPHTVFCDIKLPGDMNGFDFAVTVRCNPAYSNIRLVAISGYAADDVESRARASGFDRLLCKPVKFADLNKLIFGDEQGTRQR